MAGSRASRIVLCALVLLGALGAAALETGLGLGSDSPLAVDQVPSTLPAQGVQLEDGAIVLTPWTTTPRRAISAAQAIAAARAFSNRPAVRVFALRVEVSTPGGWPMGSFGSTAGRTAGHARVWLVTFTPPKPIDTSGGGLIPFYVSQFSYAVNPITGKVAFGFETPFPCRYANFGSSLAVCQHAHTVQWESRRLLGDGNPQILRTETVRDLGGNPETVATLRGNFRPLSVCRAPAPVYQRRCAGPKASYAWLDIGDMGNAQVTTASQLAAIYSAQRASPRLAIFPDFTYISILCPIPVGNFLIANSPLRIAAACSTSFIGPRTIRFQERWPVSAPGWMHSEKSGWIVALGRNGDVRSIRQFGELSAQLGK